MNKVIVTMIAIIVIISAIFTAVAIVSSNQDENAKEEVEISNQEEIYDECTDEYEAMQQETMKTNSEEEKTSPNCSLTLKTYFKKCDHTTSVYLNLPENQVNLSKEEIQEKYPNYVVQSFASNEVVLYQEKEGECGEHYLVKDDNGIVAVYKILEDGSLEKQETTGISTEYLPEADRVNMETGVKINGKQLLNQLLEDYE